MAKSVRAKSVRAKSVRARKVRAKSVRARKVRARKVRARKVRAKSVQRRRTRNSKMSRRRKTRRQSQRGGDATIGFTNTIANAIGATNAENKWTDKRETRDTKTRHRGMILGAAKGAAIGGIHAGPPGAVVGGLVGTGVAYAGDKKRKVENLIKDNRVLSQVT